MIAGKIEGLGLLIKAGDVLMPEMWVLKSNLITDPLL
jgi:hypothetical protein